MGRQKGQSQRTKGNVRPSSSGRAASLLSNEQGFVGFSAMSGDLGYVPVLKSLDEDQDGRIDADLRVVLSKLSKRDITTKLKALSEFCDLCKIKNAEDAESILPYWPRIYNRLSEDTDRRVREHSQNALQSLVALLGKKIAPHLKNIMGCWWVVQCDSHAPAASAALKAFHTAFPSLVKQRKALMFCFQEVFQTLHSNIFTSSKPSQGNLTEEDIEKNKERVISTSLNALASFLHTLNVESIKQISVSNLETFYQNPRLWKLSKHKSPTVRSAFYCVVSCFCTQIKNLVVDQLPTMCKCVLHKLDERNPIVCRSVWDAAEVLTSSFDVWFDHIDIRKGFLPQLWSLLKNGCYGNAKIVSPHLLPVISNFPSSISTRAVYAELFNCLEHGLMLESTIRSSIETKAIITAFVECMQLVLQKSIEKETTSWDVIDLILSDNLIPFIQRSLTTQNFHQFFIFPLHQLFAHFLHSLSQKCLLDNDYQETYVEVYSKLWRSVLDSGKSIVNEAKEKDIANTTFERFLNFLVMVRSVSVRSSSNNVASTVKNKHVKFTDSFEEGLHPIPAKDNFDIKTHLYRNLLTNVSNIVLYVLNENIVIPQKVFILSRIFLKFADNLLFQKLSNILLTEESSELTSSCYVHAFLTEHILPIIRQAFLQKHTEQLCRTVAFLLSSCVRISGDEVVSMLETIVCEPSLFGGHEMCIFLFQNLVKDGHFFLKSESECLIKFLLSLVNDWSVADENTSSEVGKLLFSLLTGHQNKPLLCPKFVISLLNELTNLLSLAPTNCVIEIVNIFFSCFNTYVDCLDVVDVSGHCLINGLLSLLKLSSEQPSDQVLLSVKNAIGSLLKTAYNSESSTVSKITENVCKKGATFMASSLFSVETTHQSITSFVQVAPIFAEEFVMHHMTQSYITEWLDCILPSESQMSVLRPSFKSQNWINFHEIDFKDIPIHFNYISVMQAYGELFCELNTFFSEVFHGLSRNSGLQLLFIELLLAKAVTSYYSDLTINLNSEYDEEFIAEVSAILVQNSVQVGGGWLVCFDQFTKWATSTQWNESSIVKCISLDNSQLSGALADTLTVFLRKCSSIARIESILDQIVQQFFEITCSFDKDDNLYDILPLSLNVIRICMNRINELKKFSDEENSLSLHIDILDKLLVLKSSYPNLFLFDCDLIEASDVLLKLNTAIIQFLECIVNVYPCTLSTEIWDFIECSFVSWMESCNVTYAKSCSHDGRKQIGMLKSTCSLMLALERFITSSEAINDPTIPVSLGREWGEFFKPAAQALLLSVFANLTKSDHPHIAPLLTTMGNCLESIMPTNLLSCSSNFETQLIPDSPLADSVQTLLHHIGSILLSKESNHVYIEQMICYSLLSKLKESIFNNEDGTVISVLKPPEHLIHTLDVVSPKVNNAFSSISAQKDSLSVKVKRVSIKNDELSEDSSQDEEEEINAMNLEEEVDIIPHASTVSSYLLTWRLLIGLSHHAPADLRPQYTAALLEFPLTSVSILLSNLSLLLPSTPFVESMSEGSTGKSSMFSCDLNLSLATNSSTFIPHLACLLYKDVLLSLPVAVRSWFSSLNKTNRAFINDYTSKYVTPAICKEEFDSVFKSKTPPDLEVKARRVAREVVATYEVSEADFEINIQLPPNYPLSPVQVTTVRKAGVSATQWRYWILQMTMLLQNQNGTILDALLLWKQKVDKRLVGLEECMICFSIVHGTNAQSLPKLQCKTCKKKYHAECLYKWFDTSNQATCPLCRSPMMFK